MSKQDFLKRVHDAGLKTAKGDNGVTEIRAGDGRLLGGVDDDFSAQTEKDLLAHIEKATEVRDSNRNLIQPGLKV